MDDQLRDRRIDFHVLWAIGALRMTLSARSALAVVPFVGTWQVNAAIELVRQLNRKIARELLLNAETGLDRIRIYIVAGIDISDATVVLTWASRESKRANISLAQHRERQFAARNSFLPDGRRTNWRRISQQRGAEVQLIAKVALQANSGKDLRGDWCVECSAAAAKYRFAIAKDVPGKP